MVFFPISLLLYMTISAQPISSNALEADSGYSATPMLTVILISWPPLNRKGLRMRSWIRSWTPFTVFCPVGL